MASFFARQSYDLDLTGTYLILRDDSAYGDNDDGLNISDFSTRVWTIIKPNNTQALIPLPYTTADNNRIVVPITDGYYVVQLLLTTITGETYPSEMHIAPVGQAEYQKYKMLDVSCECTPKVSADLNNAGIFLNNAVYKAQYQNIDQFESNLNAAETLLGL